MNYFITLSIVDDVSIPRKHKQASHLEIAEDWRKSVDAGLNFLFKSRHGNYQQIRRLLVTNSISAKRKPDGNIDIQKVRMINKDILNNMESTSKKHSIPLTDLTELKIMLTVASVRQNN